VPLLVKGMQKQQAIIEKQNEEISTLKAQLDKITAALATMSGSFGAGAGILVEK
jgi:hypothetical protein